MSRINKVQHSEDKKQSIIDAAIKVLSEKGYHKCPVDVIAKTAGIAKGTVYLYFKTKDELYFSIFYWIFNEFKKITEEVIKEEQRSASDQLYMLLERASAFSHNYRNLMISLRHDTTMTNEFHQSLMTQFSGVITAINTIMEKGIRSGEFRAQEPSVMSMVFVSLASMVVHQKIDACGAKTIDVEPRQIFDILLKGIAV